MASASTPVSMAIRRCRWSCRSFARAALLCGCLATTTALAQTTVPGWGERFLTGFNDTTSVGMIPEAERRDGWKGWFADAWDGSKRIFRDGRTDLVMPLYTFHPPYAYPNRDQENHYPWGAGLSRTWIDGKDNERIVYAMAFSDSHYDFQPAVGYAWMARWPLGAGLKGGLGYTAFVAMRADANYIPFPAILPLASIGTDRFTVYGTWIPTTDVLFFFARISLSEGPGGAAPAVGGGAGLPFGGTGGQRDRPNVILASAAYVNADADGIDTAVSDNSWAPMIGYRRFFTENVALDVSVSRSRHTLDYNGARIGSFDYMPVTVTGQYHLPVYGGLRLYAGLGIAYSRITSQDMPGYSLASDSISPTIQTGATYALTDSLQLTGGLTVNFPRNELKQGSTELGTLKLSPVAFSIGVGWSF
jgi:outer membrane protein W